MEALTPWHLLLILLAVILLFGYKKLPDASRSVGRSLRIFKSELRAMPGDEPSTSSSPDEAADGPAAGAHAGAGPAALPAPAMPSSGVPSSGVPSSGVPSSGVPSSGVPSPEALDAEAAAAEELAARLRDQAAQHVTRAPGS